MAGPVRIAAGQETVSGLVTRPEQAWCGYLLAHGAGAGIRHPFLERVSQALGDRGIATLRYQFPYMEKGGGRPDAPAVAQRTVAAAATFAQALFEGLPLLAGGKSFGGRMTGDAQAADPLPGVVGLVFLGYPLHPPKRPSSTRARALERVAVPMLFLQGTRDDLADLELMNALATRLGARTTLHVVEGADHSFEVLKRSGRSHLEVLEELADRIAEWGRAVVRLRAP
jgi:predicted alpha/beta-hydrolase family hydrolase